MEIKVLVDSDIQTSGKMQFSGYASVFNVRDSANDIVCAGAFNDTIRKDRKRIKILYQHDVNEPIGQPLHLEEDKHGLYFVGKLAPTKAGVDCYQLIKDGVINEMSIGYDVVDSTYDRSTSTRYLKKIKLWEISPVSFACNSYATITDVKRNGNVERHHDCTKVSYKKIKQMNCDTYVDCTHEVCDTLYTQAQLITMLAKAQFNLSYVPGIIFYRAETISEAFSALKNNNAGRIVASNDARGFTSRMDSLPKVYIRFDTIKNFDELVEVIFHECAHLKTYEMFTENELIKNKELLEALAQRAGKMYS